MNTAGATLVYITEDAGDLHEIFRLRYFVFCEEIYSLDPLQYPNKEETDAYDPYSVQIIAKESGETVGSMRMVKDNPLGFVIEQQFILPPNIDREHAVEYSRATVKKTHRIKGILSLLLDCAAKWRLNNNFFIAISAATAGKPADILLAKGWTAVGAPIPNYHNTTVIPLMHDLRGKP